MIGSIIGAAGGIVGNIMNYNSQQSTNDWNYRINMMNNRFNAEEAQKNRDWQYEMWQMNNAYNSPEQQVSRMKSAGLNPYMSGAVGSGNSSSTPFGDPASAGPSGNMVAPRLDTSGMLNSISSIIAAQAQSRKVTAEVGNISQDTTFKLLANSFYPTLMNAQLNKLYGDTNYRNKAIGESGYWDSQGWNAAALDQSIERQQFLNLQQSNRLMAAQESSTLLSAETQKILNRYLPAQQQADLLIKSQQYSNLIAQKKLTSAQASTELAKQILISAQANGQKISNDIARRTANGVIQATNQANILSFRDSFYDAANVKLRKRTEYETNTAKKEYFKHEADLTRKQSRTHYFDTTLKSLSGVGNSVGTVRRAFPDVTRPVIKGFGR